MSLVFTEAADLQLRTLEADPTQRQLLAEIDLRLTILEHKPGSDTVRSRRFNHIWVIEIRGFDYWICWRPLNKEDQLVVYVGPAL